MKSKFLLFIFSLIILTVLVIAIPFVEKLSAKSRLADDIGHLNRDTITYYELGIPEKTSDNKTEEQQATNDTAVASESVILQEAFKSIAILAYHHIGEGKYSDWTVIDSDFAQQMMELYNAGYQAITLHDLLEYQYNGVQIPLKSFVLTFDDGYQTMYTIVAPILREYDFKATFFIPTNFIKEKEKDRMTNSWDTEDQLNFPKYHMIWSEVKELSSDGHEIASHGLNHIPIGSDLLSDETYEDEINGSKKEIEDRLGTEVYSFAYPSASYSQKVIEYLMKYGYLGAVIGGNIRVNMSDFDAYLLPRFFIKREATIDDILSYVQGSD